MVAVAVCASQSYVDELGVAADAVTVTLTDSAEGVIIEAEIEFPTQERAEAARTELNDLLETPEKASTFLSSGDEVSVTASAVDVSEVEASIVAKEADGGGVGAGSIAGAVVGAVLGVGLLVAAAVCFAKRSGGKSKPPQQKAGGIPTDDELIAVNKI